MITDGHPARARGLNVIGLRRAGLSGPRSSGRSKEAYRLLLRSGLPPRARPSSGCDALGDPLADEMAAFVRGSKRGFAHAHRGGAARPEPRRRSRSAGL